VEREQSIVVQRYGTVHSEKEIDHQGEFQDHVRGKLFRQILVALPRIRNAVDVEFWGTDKFTSFTQVSFQNGNGIVQREAQCHGEEGKKEFDIVHKIIETATLNALVSEPITDEQDNGAHDEEAGYFKDPTQMTKNVFDIQHRDAQQGHNEHTKEHGTVQQVHYTMELGLARNVLGSDYTPE